MICYRCWRSWEWWRWRWWRWRWLAIPVNKQRGIGPQSAPLEVTFPWVRKLDMKTPVRGMRRIWPSQYDHDDDEQGKGEEDHRHVRIVMRLGMCHNLPLRREEWLYGEIKKHRNFKSVELDNFHLRSPPQPTIYCSLPFSNFELWAKSKRKFSLRTQSDKWRYFKFPYRSRPKRSDIRDRHHKQKYSKHLTTSWTNGALVVCQICQIVLSVNGRIMHE